MKEKPKITVGIVTRDRLSGLKNAIRSVYDQEFSDLEIVVVDNASRDGTLEVIGREYPDVRLLRLEENRGCPGGRNHLYRHARGEIIVNLDDDGQLGPGSLFRIVETFTTDPAIGVVSGRLAEPGSPDPNYFPCHYRDVGIFRGGVSAFRQKMLEEIGWYPDDFFFFKEEEYLSLKALDAGWRIVFNPQFIIYHPLIRSASFSRPRLDYYLFRNPLFVVIELFPGIYLWKYLFLRIGSYALASLHRGSFSAYCQALGALPKKMRQSWRGRRPVRPASLKRYLALRSKLPEGELEYNQMNPVKNSRDGE